MSIVKICCKLFSFSPLKKGSTHCVGMRVFCGHRCCSWNGIIRSQLVYIVIGRLLCFRGRAGMGLVGIGSLALE